ncbi:MAG: 2-oxoisovalerate dehydrogenase [Melioribacteraceae bacterium]
MKNEIIFIVEDSLDGGYEAKALEHSIYTEAETMEELKKNIVEAVNTHFDEDEKPHIIRIHYIKEELLSA